MRKHRKFILIAALYLAQGLPYGFFVQALPVLLRNAHVSLPEIGMTQILTIPWALKFIWAPAVDRWHFPGMGLRKSWLIPLQLLSVLTFAALCFFSPANSLRVVMIAFLLTNAVAASQDIATDGLAVDLLSPEERGWANGIQVAGYRLGMMIGGGALLWIYERTSWPTVMLSMSLIALICTLPVFLFREPPRALRPSVKSLTDVAREILHFIAKPGALAWIAILVFYKAAHYSATGMLRPLLVDRGYSLGEIAGLLGAFSFGAGFLGAMIGGGLASKFDRRKLLVAFAALEAVAVSGYLWPLLSEPTTFKLAASTAFDHFASGLSTAVLFTLMMDACSSERAASDYTFQSCIVVAATGGASALSGFSAANFGYGVHFSISALLAAFAFLLTAWGMRLDSIDRLLSTRDR